MKQHLKQVYREKIKSLFRAIRYHPHYLWLMSRPLWFRLLLAGFLIVFGVIALVTPIPAGWVMITFAGVLIFGLHKVKRQGMRAFFALRFHILIEKVRKLLSRFWG